MLKLASIEVNSPDGSPLAALVIQMPVHLNLIIIEDDGGTVT